MLFMVPVEALHGMRPSSCWTLKHDIDLCFGCYKYGIGQYEEYFKDKELIFSLEKKGNDNFRRLTDRIKMIV